MTTTLVDVASWQGPLNPVDVARAGFDVVNLKVSHGLGQLHVHPDVAGWVASCRMLGLGLSSFHYLTGEASGEAQAEYAWSRLAALGLLYGTAHLVDVEAPTGITLTIVRGYLERMTELLGRPVGLYTGDWWWRGRGWDVSALTPYLMAAPNDGYPGVYPGDTSTDWMAGYGGWPVLSVMQYAVGPLSFPDGTRGTINVSKAAIRDPKVWSALSIGRTGMSYAPATILAARTLILKTLPAMDPLSVGIVGDDSHAKAGTSYHLGKDALRSDAYSIVESSRDRDGLTDAASALDVGWFAVTVAGKAHNLRSFSIWLVAQCKANTADTKDIREVIYSPDGVVVKRWDRLGIRSTGPSSHLTHTHLSYFRDSEKRDKVSLFLRYFTTTGLIQGDDVSEQDVTNALTKFFARDVTKDDAGKTTNITSQVGRDAGDQFVPNPFIGAKGPSWQLEQNTAQSVQRIETVVGAILAGVQVENAEIPASAQAIADAVLADLNSQTVEDTAAALLAVLGPEKAAKIAQLWNAG